MRDVKEKTIKREAVGRAKTTVMGGEMTLREARRRLGLTQVQMARKLKLSRPFITQIETDKRACPAYILKRAMVMVREAEKQGKKHPEISYLDPPNVSIRDEVPCLSNMEGKCMAMASCHPVYPCWRSINPNQEAI